VIQPVQCVKLNVNGLLNVLEAATSAQVKKLIFASSAAVYGSNTELPSIETMRPEPQSPYAVTKLDGEYYCAIWQRQTALQTACLRFFNVFGPRQDPNSSYAAALPVFIRNARNGAPIPIYSDGEQTRDFVYVKDVVDSMAHVCQTESLVETYNIGYGCSVSIQRLVETILDATHSRSQIEFGPPRVGDVRHSCACVDKLWATGWQPPYGFEAGLDATLGATLERGLDASQQPIFWRLCRHSSVVDSIVGNK